MHNVDKMSTFLYTDDQIILVEIKRLSFLNTCTCIGVITILYDMLICQNLPHDFHIDLCTVLIHGKFKQLIKDQSTYNTISYLFHLK
jgi:hypothetical protein